MLLMHQQRVVDEQHELDDKITKLNHFIQISEIFPKLDSAEQERLNQQLGYMQKYSEVLGARIAAFTK